MTSQSKFILWNSQNQLVRQIFSLSDAQFVNIIRKSKTFWVGFDGGFSYLRAYVTGQVLQVLIDYLWDTMNIRISCVEVIARIYGRLKPMANGNPNIPQTQMRLQPRFPYMLSPTLHSTLVVKPSAKLFQLLTNLFTKVLTYLSSIDLKL